MNDHLAELLARCLDRIAAGDSLDAILADHPAHRDVLEPLLAAASLLGEYDPQPPEALGDRVMADIASTPQWDPRQERPASAPDNLDRSTPGVNGVGPSSAAAIPEHGTHRGRTPGPAVPDASAADDRSEPPPSRALDAAGSHRAAAERASSAGSGTIRPTWLLRAASVLAAVGIAVAGMNVASADSRPGDMLWPVRRALDGAQELMVAGVRTVIAPALNGWSRADDPGADGAHGPMTSGDRAERSAPDGGPGTSRDAGGARSAGDAEDAGPTTVPRKTAVALADVLYGGTPTRASRPARLRASAAPFATVTPEVPFTGPWQVGDPSPAAEATAGPTRDPRQGNDHEEPGDESPTSTATTSPSYTPGPAPSSTATEPVAPGPTTAHPATASPTSPAVCAAVITGHVRYADHVPATGATVIALHSAAGVPPIGPPDLGRFPDAPRAVVVGSGGYHLSGLCPGRYFIQAVGERGGRPHAGTHGHDDGPLPVPVTARDTQRHGVDITMRPVDRRAPPSPPAPGPGPGPGAGSGPGRGVVQTATPTASPTVAPPHAAPGIPVPPPRRSALSPTSSAP